MADPYLRIGCDPEDAALFISPRQAFRRME